MPKRKTPPSPVVPISEEERISLGFRPKNVPKLTKDDLDFIAIERLNRDLRQAAIALTPNEIRYLVDFYYQCQEDRKRAAAQLRAAAGDAEPNAFLTWASEQALRQEGNIRAALTISSKSSVEGEWMQMIHGIGPVLTAGLLAHIDIRRAPTVTHIWSYAGLNPEQSWLGDAGARELVASVVPEKVKRGYDYGQHVDALAKLAKRRTENMWGIIANLMDEEGHVAGAPVEGVTRAILIKAFAMRPWNAKLKTLCWKIGDSFTKISNSGNDTMYGRIYRDHKALVVQKNLEGGYAELARKTLETRNIQDHDTLKTYQAGQLPAGRLDLGARRKAEKMFLSHLHEVLYRLHYLTEPVRPWILRTDPRHTHYIPPPFLDIILAEVERRKRAQGRKPTPLPRTALPDDDDVL